MAYGGYKKMWVVVMFDLPTVTHLERHNYAKFRKALLDDGFYMMQFSVYSRPCYTDENAQVHKNRVEYLVPIDGQVRLLMLTDKQFERMIIFNGKKRQKPEQIPSQLSFF
jgi:CRISPR-associated protein Cas2